MGQAVRARFRFGRPSTTSATNAPSSLDGQTEHFGAGWIVGAGAFLLLIAIMAILAPVIAPGYSGSDFRAGGLAPRLGWRFLLGSDVTGRPILDYIILGARTTFAVAMLASAISLASGLLAFRLVAASSWLKAILGFVRDLGLLLPLLPLVLILVLFVAGGDPWAVAGIMGLCGAPLAVRMLDRDRVRTSPPSTHLMTPAGVMRYRPATTLGSVARAATLLSVGFIALSATVDFLGAGVPESDPSWGNALSGAQIYMGAGYWWWLLFPGLALVLTIVALTMAGGATIRWADKGTAPETEPPT